MTNPQTPHPFWLRVLVGAALAGISFGLLLLSQPPYGLWLLLLVGFVPMLIAQYRILPAALSSVAPAITVGSFLGVLIRQIFGTVAEQIWFIGALPLFIIGIVYLTELGSRSLNRRTGYRWFVLQGALVWVGIEMIRNLVPVLGTGGFVAYAFYRSPWLIQPLSIFGIFGLNLLAMLAAYALGLGALALFDRWSGRHAWQDASGVAPVPGDLARGWLAGAGFVWAAWTAISLALYFTPSTGETVRVAAVQPGAPKYAIYADLARQAAAQGAELIVFPEGSLNFDPQTQHTAELRALAQETGAYLVFGVGIRSAQGLRNEAVALSPQGEFLGVYGKDHPLTFLGEGSLSRGNYPVYATEFGAFSTIICFDLNFNDTARQLAGAGAKLLAVPSNDWASLSTRQVAYLTFRAIENRVATVKADTQYDSLVINGRGDLVAARITSEGSQQVLVTDVPVGTSGTPYQQMGDWLGWVSLVGLVFFSVPNPLLKKRGKGGSR